MGRSKGPRKESGGSVDATPSAKAATIRPEQRHARAQRHLAKTSPTFRDLIRRVGPCTLEPSADSYAVLVGSIISQQIATKAAKAITKRLFDKAAPHPLTPDLVAALSDEELRACGLSATKQRYVKALTEHVRTNAGFLEGLVEATDQEVTAALIPIPGIGPWTVEMFLMFGLGRPDVLPVKDLGLQMAVRDLFELGELPKPAKLTELAEPWRPYRTVATWYMWRSRGFVPQSGIDE